MKLIIMAVMLAVFSVATTSVFADSCYLCGSGSTNGCQQCRYGNKDTGDARKACASKGCQITGTGSCSTAANVKVCRAPAPADTQPVIAWCAPH